MLPPGQPDQRDEPRRTGPIGLGSGSTPVNPQYKPRVTSPTPAFQPCLQNELDDVRFWKEVRAYASIPNIARERYAGLYVAVYNGDIVDSDPDEAVLADRFYRTFGYVPVLIHAVGIEDSVIDLLD